MKSPSISVRAGAPPVALFPRSRQVAQRGRAAARARGTRAGVSLAFDVGRRRARDAARVPRGDLDSSSVLSTPSAAARRPAPPRRCVRRARRAARPPRRPCAPGAAPPGQLSVGGTPAVWRAATVGAAAPSRAARQAVGRRNEARILQGVPSCHSSAAASSWGAPSSAALRSHAPDGSGGAPPRSARGGARRSDSPSSRRGASSRRGGRASWPDRTFPLGRSQTASAPSEAARAAAAWTMREAAPASAPRQTGLSASSACARARRTLPHPHRHRDVRARRARDHRCAGWLGAWSCSARAPCSAATRPGRHASSWMPLFENQPVFVARQAGDLLKLYR